MTDKQIKDIGEEFRKEFIAGIRRKGVDPSERCADIAVAGMILNLKWLAKRYCLVEKDKLEGEYHEAKFTCGNVDPCSETFVASLAQKSLLERLFPDLGKEVEE